MTSANDSLTSGASGTSADDFDAGDDGEVRCSHDWALADDSFDHEFGTEVILFWACENCSLTKPFVRGHDAEGGYDDKGI
jgi:hypothetical protein